MPRLVLPRLVTELGRGVDPIGKSAAVAVTSNSPPPLWLPLLGSGLELATATIAGLAIGYAIDRWAIGGGSIATVSGLVIGFVLGMIRFVRRATQITKRVAEAQVEALKNRRDDMSR